MARITTYALDSNISLNDKLVGTDADDSSITKNYSIDTLGDGLISLKSIITGTGTGTLNTIPVFTPDGQSIGDSMITQNSAGNIANVAGRLSIDTDLSVSGYARFSGEVQDGTNSPGTSGQLLTSTASGVEWADPYIRSEKVIVSTAELKDLHNTPKILVDVTSGNPKEICQVYSVVFGVGNNNLSNNLVFPNDINIESDNASAWKYVIPQSVANEQGVIIPYYNPSLTAGRIGLDSDVVLSSAGAAVETGTATTTMTVWITYRIFDINA